MRPASTSLTSESKDAAQPAHSRRAVRSFVVRAGRMTAAQQRAWRSTRSLNHFDLANHRPVARARIDLEDAGVAAGAGHEPRPHFLEQPRHRRLVRQDRARVVAVVRGIRRPMVINFSIIGWISLAFASVVRIRSWVTSETRRLR